MLNFSKSTKLNSQTAKQPLKDMELQEKDEEKDENHIKKLFRENPEMRVCVVTLKAM